MPTIDVQLIAFHEDSTDPSERYVNTLQFVGDATAAEHETELQAVLDAWVVRPSLSWATYVADGVGEFELRAYNRDDDPPREPFILNNTVAGTHGGSGEPAQIALCGSFYSSRNLPKQRGRIYFGPLATTNVEHPTPTILNAALDVLEAIAAVNSATWTWVCGSVQGAVTDIWANDVWDTQRRRVPEETSRIQRSL